MDTVCAFSGTEKNNLKFPKSKMFVRTILNLSAIASLSHGTGNDIPDIPDLSDLGITAGGLGQTEDKSASGMYSIKQCGLIS